MNATTVVTGITRSSNGLVEALFDSIDRLNRREIDAEHARAVSHTARSIIAMARLELEFRQMENPALKLSSLVIDAKPAT